MGYGVHAQSAAESLWTLLLVSFWSWFGIAVFLSPVWVTVLACWWLARRGKRKLK